ncbi:MAG: PAS domain S-box protein [Euryarchaeota archaeon]|nr:PAS domain S-box protein [Euryarchaeota archaeon]
METPDAVKMGKIGDLREALRHSRCITYALVDGQGKVIEHNSAFMEALDQLAKRELILQELDHPLAKKFEEKRLAALQNGYITFSWGEGGEYEIISLGERETLIIGKMTSPPSHIISDEEDGLYSKLFMHALTPMMLIEPYSTRIVDVNLAATRFYGYDRETMLSMIISDLNVLSREEMYVNMRIALREGGGRFYFRHRLASGEVRDVEVYSRPIRIQQRELLHSIVLDVTKRKQAERIARQSGQRYQVLSDASFEGVLIHSDLIILDANRAFCELMGGIESQLVGRNFLDFTEPECVERVREHAAEERSEPYEITLRTLDGRKMLVEARGGKVIFQDRPARVATIVDITGRKLIEIDLERERARLRATLDSLPVGVFIADVNGRVVETNSMATEIWGGQIDISDISDYSKFIGFWADTGIRLRAEDWNLARAVLKRETTTSEMIDIIRFDGRKGTVLNSAAPIISSQGELLGGVVIAQDITRQSEIERRARLDKERSELYLDLLTHDINNLNAVAMGYLQLLRERVRLDEKSEFLLSQPIKALQDSSDLIASISIIQRGDDALREIELGTVLREVISDVPIPSNRKVDIEIEGLDGLVIETSGLIKEAFYNLIDNAIRHSTGPVHIWIRGQMTNYHVMISIEDDGPGISDDLKSRLFERKRGGGRFTSHGLGLFLVRSLVESHGGRVRVEDRIPRDHTQGTRFVIDLPLAGTPSGNSLGVRQS